MGGKRHCKDCVDTSAKRKKPISRPHFSRAEYAARVAKIRAAMATRDIELLFVSDPSNMCWLTGYDG